MRQSQPVSATDVAAVAAEAFVFGYPLVLMNRMRASMTAVQEPDPARMRAPANRWVHARELPEATAGRPAGPQASTLRSSAWLDLGAGPVVLRVPGTYGRFYALSLVDLWSSVFASVGARTTGAAAGVYVISRPGLAGAAVPPEALPIHSPTRMVRIAGLTQVDRDGSCSEAHAIQDAYELTPLVTAPRQEEGGERPDGRTPPTVQIERLDAPTFFAELAGLMRDNPPRLEDRPLVERMRSTGLLLDAGAGLQALGADVVEAVSRGAARGLARVLAAAESPPGDVVGDWHIRFRIGEYGTDYLGRAAAACAGLEPGPAADELPAMARTDAHGRQLTGRDRYLLRFPAGALPPVHGFWTLTTYDARQPLVDNPVECYSIGDWNGLALEPDGAVAIRIQHRNPGGRATNWLPAPPCAFNLLLRLCWPQQEILDRAWAPPPVLRMADPRVVAASPDRDDAAPAGAP
jgi:hypothetical protein